MKYQINQARLDEVIMGYIDSMFSGIEMHTDININNSYYEDYVWWGKGDERMIDLRLTSWRARAVGIQSAIWRAVKGLFNLTADQTDEYFIRWMRENLNIIPVEIHLF